MQDVEVKALFDAVDSSKDGEIQYEELVSFLVDSPSANSSSERQQLRDVFNTSGPGSSRCGATDQQAPARRKQQSRAVIGRSLGLGEINDTKATPGPSTYEVKHESVRTSAPAVRISGGPAHEALHKAAIGPGPADYDIARSLTSRHRSPRRCSIGQQARCEDVFLTSSSSWCPGPAAYSTDYEHQSHQRKQPSATFGHARLRTAEVHTTPGPAEYNTVRKARILGGARFGGTADRFQRPPLSPVG
eukprot:TRINITY_DN21897_c0_g2_i1.p1 TRINITY_DN21897_c0_g2~~TRINITY_DN21897_c0_g2_i1.p1  ORF type:complete len:246 (-),score=33.64 TRINITY_DN21897_c0_g2_i1:46-783(-)